MRFIIFEHPKVKEKNMCPKIIKDLNYLNKLYGGIHFIIIYLDVHIHFFLLRNLKKCYRVKI
jgi:hypothetical protein